MRPFDRRTLIRSAAGAAVTCGFGRAFAQSSATTTFNPFLLLVHCDGGWDQAMVFDNKTSSGYVAAEKDSTKASGGGNLPFVDNPGRPSTAAFFKKYGANAAIVNGVNVGTMDHRVAVQRTFGAVPTGKSRAVDWGSYYAASLNPVLPMPHCVIDAPFMPGEYEAVAVRLTKATIAEYAAMAGGQPGDTLGSAGETALQVFRKTEFTGIVDKAQTDSLDGDKLRGLYYGAMRDPLIASSVQKATKKVGAQGTDDDFTYAGKLAVELFAQSFSQAVTLQAGADGLWNTMTDNFALQTSNYEMLFAGLANILAYAKTRGVDTKMTIIVSSEMGRAPKLNALGGKGPWPYTSALLWGVGINGGIVAGVTDAALRGLPVDPVFGTQGGATAVTLEMAHVIAAYYLKTNVPAKLMLPNSQPLAQVIKGSAT